jgi:hypothetical protein
MQKSLIHCIARRVMGPGPRVKWPKLFWTDADPGSIDSGSGSILGQKNDPDPDYKQYFPMLLLPGSWVWVNRPRIAWPWLFLDWPWPWVTWLTGNFIDPDPASVDPENFWPTLTQGQLTQKNRRPWPRVNWPFRAMIHCIL